MRARWPGDSDLRAVPILAALGRHDVSFVLVGSYGVIVQGVDLAMADLDIVPAMGAANRDRLVAALKDLGARGRRGVVVEAAYELMEDPSRLTELTLLFGSSRPSSGTSMSFQASQRLAEKRPVRVAERGRLSGQALPPSTWPRRPFGEVLPPASCLDPCSSRSREPSSSQRSVTW